MRVRAASCGASTQTDADTQTDRAEVFECNICLDAAHEPVVTYCGHLYCWPCIYRWLDVSAEPACPVCKAPVSQKRLVPVYGRGKPQLDPRFSPLDEPAPSGDVCVLRPIPSRPHSRRPELHRRAAAAQQADPPLGLPTYLGGVPVSLLAYVSPARAAYEEGGARRAEQARGNELGDSRGGAAVERRGSERVTARACCL
jgi:hypothetical protein